MALAALIISLVSAATAIAVSLVAWRQLREARIANALPAAIDLFREYRSDSLTTARKVVFAELGGAEESPAMSALPDNVRPSAYLISHFLDNLGVLVAEGLMKPELAARFLGDTAISLWLKLEPSIQKERELRASRLWSGARDYQRYFEDLAVTLRQLEPEVTRRGLKRWMDST